MRNRKTVFIVLATLLVLISGPGTGRAAAEEPVIEAVGMDFEPGVVIHVCWRMVEPENPFLAKGPFNCEATVKAVDAPFPGGGITGDQLMGVAEKAVGAGKIKEVRARSLEAGKAAGDPGAGMMTVDRGASEFYNSYVGRDKDGRLVIFFGCCGPGRLDRALLFLLDYRYLPIFQCVGEHVGEVLFGHRPGRQLDHAVLR